MIRPPLVSSPGRVVRGCYVVDSQEDFFGDSGILAIDPQTDWSEDDGIAVSQRSQAFLGQTFAPTQP